jgi:hypothetical protein
MTPTKAVREECRRCTPRLPGRPWSCESKVCSLTGGGYALGKIKAHCRECNGEDHPKKCSGEIPGGSSCPLHPYRLGNDPGRAKRILSPEQREKLAANLARGRAARAGKVKNPE